ncbi:MAG: dATP pyrophosphohydrolase, partial [Pseudomonadota bacterium]
PAVSTALLQTAEAWLRTRGAEKIVGPFNFTINEDCGVLVDGFEDPPALMMPHGRPYYADALDRAGYAKAKDLIAYRFDLANAAVPPRLKRLVDRVASDSSVTLRALNPKAFSADVATVMDIFNDAWSENWGFVPFSDAEISHVGANMRPVLRPDWGCIAELNGEAVAFALALPNVNEAIADLDGRLLPFGWAKLLYRLKIAGVKSVRMPLMGVRKSLQGATVGAALSFAVIQQVHERCRESGVEMAELSWILEDNVSMRRMIEEIGGVPYKTYRMFEKALV